MQVSPPRETAGAALLLLALGAASQACVSAAPHRPAVAPLAQRAPLSLEAQVQVLERASEPGPEHRDLEPFVGRFDVVLVAVGTDGAESELARGDAQIAWVLERHYLRWEAGLFIGGRRRESSGFLGFDRRAQQHCLFTITSLSTGMSIARGTGDPARAGIRFTLEQVDPASGAMVRMTSVLRSIDADHFVLDQLGADASGNERVLQRSHYRRSAVRDVKT